MCWNIDAKKWNSLLAEALKAVRSSNPDRCVVVGPVWWNDVKMLPYLDLPADDKNLLVTFHYYEPRPFTHQGAPWSKDSDKWLKTKWIGLPAERAEIKAAFDFAENWGKQHHRPMYVVWCLRSPRR
jgi:endoglucanase